MHQLSAGNANALLLPAHSSWNTAVLLLDEPLTGLDEGCASTARRDRSSASPVGATFLAVTHNHDEALSLSDNIAFCGEAGSADRHAARVVRTTANAFVARFIGFDTI